MDQKKFERPLKELKLKKAYRMLDEEIDSIPDVNTWADKMGVSRTWIYRHIKRKYDCSPKLLLRQKRFKKIKHIIKNNPEMTGYCVALSVGLKDEKALFKFLSKHYGSSFRKLRVKVLSGE